MNLKEVVPRGESEVLEFKKSVSEWKEIIETVSAFSNTKGGTIIIGVDDNRRVHGVTIGKNTIEELTNKILTNTEPKIYPEITEVDIEDKKVIVIKVEKFPYDVVLAFGRPFNLLSEVVEVEKFIYKNISLHAWIEEERIERQEKWEYPPKALREAIVNAIVHRDYRVPSKVQIRIFDDRIEFWNPGRLPEGWTIETLKEEHTSKPYNPLISRIFFWTGYVEEVGTGTNKMIKWCKEWELPEPDFEIKSNNIIVTFRKSKLTEEYLDKLDLSPKEKEIIQILKERMKITSSDIQMKYSVSRDTVNRWLNKLLSLNLIERKGKGKAVFYVLKEK